MTFEEEASQKIKNKARCRQQSKRRVSLSSGTFSQQVQGGKVRTRKSKNKVKININL